MATARTLYITTTAAVAGNSWFALLQDGGSAPTATNTAYGYAPGKLATNAYCKSQLGSTTTSTTTNTTTSFIDGTSGPTAGSSSTATGDSFRAGPYNGTFASASWAIVLNMRAGVAGLNGIMRCRVWKSANASGSSATALTASTLVTASAAALSTSADSDRGFTWSPGTAITLNNEYLFFQLEWRESSTTAGSSTTDTALFRAGSTITTPTFTYSTPYSMPSIAAWFDPNQNVTLASGKVSSWTDVVKGVAATQATSANQPPFSTTAMNDFPGLSMTRTAEWSLSVGSTLGGTPSTLIAVCNPEYLLGTGLTIFGPDGTQSTQFRVKDGGLLNIVKSGAVEVGTSTSAIAQGQYAIVVFKLDASTYSFAINGTAVGSGANTAGAIAVAASHFFSNQTSLTGEEYSGLIGDIIMTSIVSASADIEIAEGYLAWKYNLVQVLPTAHPFKLVPPSGPTPFLVPPRRSIVTNRRM